MSRLDISEVEAGLRAMSSSDMAAAFKKLKPALRGDQRDHARLQEGPDGRWAPRKTVVRRGKRKLGPRTRLLGRLPTAITLRAERRRLAAVSKVRWSGAHQDGMPGPKGGEIPKREHLWFGLKFLRAAEQVLIEDRLRRFGKGA